MGFLDELKGMQGDKGNPLVDIVMNMVTDPKSGGLQGLVKSFQGSGLGELAASWIGKGANEAISVENIQKVLGGVKLGEIASQLGVTENDAAGGLAKLLPDVIDKLTPDGQVPENDMLQQGLDLLKGKLFN